MDIPNLSAQLPPKSAEPMTFPVPVLLGVLAVALVAGFWLSRLVPQSSTASLKPTTSTVKNSTDNISNASQLVVGKLYGDTSTVFSDSATGTIEKGNINGVGTHILNRDGGITQRASLTSATVDLDLFVGKKVEVKGQTNASAKTGWLLDVGSIKILE